MNMYRSPFKSNFRVAGDSGMPVVAFCEICDNYTPICMECYNANTLWEVGCEYCHQAYGHEDELL